MSTALPPHITRIRTVQGEPYVQLITNPDSLISPKGLRCSVDPVLARVRQYIRSVLTGDGTRPYCPFVHCIEKQNGYHIREVPESLEEIDFAPLVLELARTFERFSPAMTSIDQPVDPTTVVTAFSHPSAMSTPFCERIDEVRNASRQMFLDRGLMIAQMHPFHVLGSSSTRKVEDPGADPLYQSSIPLLMARRMHKEDIVFMHHGEEIDAYRKFFPMSWLSIRLSPRLPHFRSPSFACTVTRTEIFGRLSSRSATMSQWYCAGKRYRKRLSRGRWNV